jgi:hypothetical protein
MVDIATIPNRFKDAVAESEHQDILNRFFPQIMIDAIDLIFFQVFAQVAVEGLGGLQIMPKRFFKNDASPCVRELGGEPLSTQMLNDQSKKLGAVAR